MSPCEFNEEEVFYAVCSTGSPRVGYFYSMEMNLVVNLGVVVASLYRHSNMLACEHRREITGSVAT